MQFPAFRFLRATGSSAGQPQGRVLGRSGPSCTRGRRSWAGPSGLVALSSGRASMHAGARARESGSTIAHLFLMGRNQAMRVYAHIIRNKRIEIS